MRLVATTTLLLFALLSFSQSSSDVIVGTNCGEIMRFERRMTSAHVIWDVPIRFANQCLEEDTLIIDFVTLTVPDKFFVTDGNTGDTLINTDWIWCNFEIIPHGTPCINGYVEYYPDTVITYDTIPSNHYLHNDTYWGKYNDKGYGRIIIPYATDYIKLHIFPSLWDDTIIGIYPHCVNDPDNICVKMVDTTMYQCYEDQEMPIRIFKMGICCDTIFRVHWKNHVIPNVWNDTTVCAGTIVFNYPPQWIIDEGLDYEIFAEDSMTIITDTILHMRIYDDTCSVLAEKYIEAIAPPIELGFIKYVKKGTWYSINLCETSWYFVAEPPTCQKYYQINSDRIILETITNDTCVYNLKYVFHVYDEVPYYAPNVINPNSSNPENRVFKIYFQDGYLGIQDDIKIFQIFDRWGNLLFQSNVPEWDGTFNGQPVDNAVFVWQLVMASGNIYYGDVIVAK